jgi:hypothetical protein
MTREVHRFEGRAVKQPKAIGYKKAIDLMRLPGRRLVRTHSERGAVFYVVPGGYVEPDTAQKIIQHPQVRASEDGMWPGMSQTWRLGAV